ncbi:hypothetical protein PR048_003102 [Dryococelus australis]|uniref:Integrase catalytic domain-containing protein n=1 Tax=Dryococelus australis TaxID=614101 RepID=A0ABQ9IM63_9NEOP|nr:hypothetical protein PR048_003102 [Dryococelus australis]
MTQLCKLLLVKKMRTTPEHPQGNGRTEHVYQMIAKMISHYVSSQHDDYDVYLPYVCTAYNSQVHTSTQLSPYEVVHGMKMSTPYEHLTVPPTGGNSHVVQLARKLCDVWKSVKQRNHAAFLQQAAQYNKKAVSRQYKVGDLVYLSNPVLIKESITLKLQLPFCSVIVHVNRVKP